MASAWGSSWGYSWGNSWGEIDAGQGVDTHDGGYSAREYEELRKRIKRAEKASRQSDEDKARERERLRASVERAYRRVVEGLPDPEEAIPALLEEAKAPVTQTDSVAAPIMPDFPALADDLAALTRFLAVLEAREREEDDIAVLLLVA